MSVGLALGIAAVLLLLNAFFVGAEFALLAARRSRIEQLAADGDRRARHALAGVRELTVMLAGAQLGITMCSLGLGAVAEPAIGRLLDDLFGSIVDIPEGVLHAITFTLALIIVVFLHMVVGEMAPKSWAISHPERSALMLARPFRWFTTLFRPVIVALNKMANGLVRLVGVQPQDELAMAHGPHDLALLLEESRNFGGIEADQHELLTRSLELSGLTAADAMTVRRDIVAVPRTSSIDALAEVAHRTGRTRVIVHEGDMDHVLGFVHAKDVLLLDHDHRASSDAASITRPVMVTHDGHRLEDLLLEMRNNRQHIALVVDELGTVVGIVTLEDVIEELIGDFDDESDRRIGDCERLPDGRIKMSGTARAEEFEACTGVPLPGGDWQTVAGYVIAVADEIPKQGDIVRSDIAVFEVLAMDGYAVDELLVRVLPRDEFDDD